MAYTRDLEHSINLIYVLMNRDHQCTGDACFRGFGRRKGERRRKAVRGCIVSADLSVLNLVIVRKGEQCTEHATALTLY